MIPRTVLAALSALLLMGGTAPLRAGDRSVTILEGAEEPAPNPTPTPPQAVELPTLRTDNPAGLTLEMRPNPHLSVGTKVAFAVSTRQPGFLVLVDINADGKSTQIYPNMASLTRTVTGAAVSNALKPGATVLIPNATNPLARFTFQADLPKGKGAIVAILSDKPVQVIDLPEASSSSLDPQVEVEALAASVQQLRIAAAGDAADFHAGSWSFAAVAYSIE